MFTGIIRHKGSITRVEPAEGSLHLTLRSEGLFAEMKPGDSVAVDGVCLTVLRSSKDEADFELGPETLRKTTFSDRQTGQEVNLERPMRLGETLDGHLVQGHVDGTGTVSKLRKDGDTVWMTIVLPPELAGLTVLKGSIAVDGVSLTVAEKENHSISIMLLPYTIEKTTFGSLKEGQKVNIETDMLAKHVAELVKAFIARTAL